MSPCPGWTPFIDPINAFGVWWALIVPLAFGMSVAYKAVRVNDLSRYWRQVGAMTVQSVAAMFLLGAAAYVLILHVIPAIVPVNP